MDTDSSTTSSSSQASQNGEVQQKEPPKTHSFWELWKIFGYILPYKGVFALGLVFLFLSTATALIFPYIASVLADVALGNGQWSINQVGFFLLIILVLQGIFSYARIWTFAYVTENAIADIRKAVYNRLIKLDLAFFEQRRVGELTSRIAADVTQLQSTFSIHIAEFLRQIATLVIGIAIIAYTSVKLTLLMLATFPIGILAAMYFGRYIRRLSKSTQDALAESNVVVEETLQSIQMVKAFTNEWLETARYDKTMERVVKLALKAAKYRGAFVSFLISAVFGGIIIVLWQGAQYVAAGSMTIGELIRFILYTFFIGAAIGGIGDIYSNIQKAIGASERITDILDETPEIQSEQLVKQEIKGDIVYQNVHFSYPTRKDVVVLKNISFHIQKGQKVALVGASGAGKSTIVQLLMRFYPLNNGSITIGNNNIQNYDISTFRSNIGTVPQEVILFGGTIQENILYGRPDATTTEVRQAALKANALEFIESFPQGFDTLVGERGIKLSGGQRQRIAIARAILKDPAILILDEATSSLDAESERLVQDALHKLMKQRTTIIIAHRLATIRNVDQIYVIDGGQIVEQGTHNELSDLEDGIYKNLLKLQFELG